jgi:uncharacterized glyoxalase superfamily protein PhnB
MITRLSHSTIFVLDHDVAFEFYVGKLGFTVSTDVTMETGFRFLTVTPPKQPDLNILLMKVETGGGPCPINPMAAELMERILKESSLGMGVFECDDCRQTFTELSAKGVKFRSEPTEQFYGIEAIMEDPFGNWFSVTQRFATS